MKNQISHNLNWNYLSVCIYHKTDDHKFLGSIKKMSICVSQIYQLGIVKYVSWRYERFSEGFSGPCLSLRDIQTVSHSWGKHNPWQLTLLFYCCEKKCSDAKLFGKERLDSDLHLENAIQREEPEQKLFACLFANSCSTTFLN